jgi:hypothetical protein
LARWVEGRSVTDFEEWTGEGAPLRVEDSDGKPCAEGFFLFNPEIVNHAFLF